MVTMIEGNSDVTGPPTPIRGALCPVQSRSGIDLVSFARALVSSTIFLRVRVLTLQYRACYSSEIPTRLSVVYPEISALKLRAPGKLSFVRESFKKSCRAGKVSVTEVISPSNVGAEKLHNDVCTSHHFCLPTLARVAD